MLTSLLLAVSIATATPARPEAGLLRSAATLSVGLPQRAPHQNIYVHAAADLYTSPKISLRSDAYWFAGEQQQRGTLTDNHAWFGGLSYHFGPGSIDPFVAIQPGFALTRTEGAFALSPMASAATGANFYVSPLFHFFAEARQVFGRHVLDAKTVPLGETRLSFGLGGNLRLRPEG